jgi:hypothetical protein
MHKLTVCNLGGTPSKMGKEIRVFYGSPLPIEFSFNFLARDFFPTNFEPNFVSFEFDSMVEFGVYFDFASLSLCSWLHEQNGA